MALSALQLAKVVRSSSQVTHRIMNFSITERTSQLFFLSFWINIPRISMSSNSHQKLWNHSTSFSGHWLMETWRRLQLSQTTAQPSLCRSMLDHLIKEVTSWVRKRLRRNLDRRVEQSMGSRFYLLIYWIPKAALWFSVLEMFTFSTTACLVKSEYLILL